jgi:hypothetical protein
LYERFRCNCIKTNKYVIFVLCVRAIPEKSVSWGQNAIDIKLSWWGVKLHLKFAGGGVNKEKECIGGRGTVIF